VGAHADDPAGRPAAAESALLSQFARLLGNRYGARVYLFGSRSRGDYRRDSDFDVVAVADAFGEQPRLGRARDRGDLWRAAGGSGIGLDLHCLTRAEFREETAGGFGAIGDARRRGELRLISRGRVGRSARTQRLAAQSTQPA
jgi:hypothetical protein